MRKVREVIPDDPHLHRWLDMAAERIAFQGLPARICWVGLGERHRLGLAFNEMVARGELSAPVVIGRDHLDSGSVASPNRETEAMLDGSDAVSDWPLLNALLNTASGATWVSLHHGGGVGMGYSQHAGMVIVADGTPDAARRLKRVLVERPRHRRDAPRRRGLRDGEGMRAGAGAGPADARRRGDHRPGAATLADAAGGDGGRAAGAGRRAGATPVQASHSTLWRAGSRAGETMYGVNTGFGKLAGTAHRARRPGSGCS